MPEDGCSIVRIECLVSEVGDQGHLVRRENTMGGYSRLEGPSTDRAYPNMIEEVRFAPDSPLEGAVSSEPVSVFPASWEYTGNFFDSKTDSLNRCRNGEEN